MDKPDSNGFIASPAAGSVRGGHEYECFKRDAENDRWFFYNSWGASWGHKGTFCYDSAGFAALLKRGGDVTQSVSLDKPPPPPQPPPDIDQDVKDWWVLTKPWATAHEFSTTGRAGIAAHAALALAKKKGL
jgi:hypothetical protein